MTHNLKRIVFLVLLVTVLLVPTPVLAEETTVTIIINDVTIHADDSVKQLGYTVNGQSRNLEKLFVPAGDVSIELNTVPEGNAFNAVRQIGEDKTPYSGNPLTVPIPASAEALRVDIYLSLAVPLPPQNSGSSSSGSVILNPTATQPQGIYTASVEDGGAAQFPASGIIFQVLMPESYAGTVVLTTYKTPLSLGETNLYHQCDITIEGQLADGETATVKFKIPLSVLQARGLTAADACLYHSGNGGKTWDKCPTVYEVRGDMVYYEATVDGFSLFMIVFEKGAAAPAGSPDLPPADVSTPGFGAVVVLGALGALWALRRR